MHFTKSAKGSPRYTSHFLEEWILGANGYYTCGGIVLNVMNADVRLYPELRDVESVILRWDDNNTVSCNIYKNITS